MGKLGSGGMVAVLLATAVEAVVINAATAPPPLHFQTCQETCGLDDMVVCAG